MLILSKLKLIPKIIQVNHTTIKGSDMKKLAIGIDLGGTNIKGIVIDKSGRGSHLTRIPTEAHKGGEHVLDKILSLIDILNKKTAKDEQIIGIGIGTPGFVDADGTVLGGAENIPGWKGVQLYSPIIRKFGLHAVASNDVTVATLAELKFGAGKGVKNMACFALGTGVGGGIIIDGKVYKGSHGMAGELGHIVVETNGFPCNCGQRGCIEQYASATGIVRIAREIYKDLAGKEDGALISEINKNPENLTSRLIYEFVNKKDPIALLVNEKFSDMLARAIGIVINVLSPDRIVLGGGVMMAGEVIIDSVKRHIPRYCWKDIWQRCDLTIAKLGEDAGVLGAGALVFEECA